MILTVKFRQIKINQKYYWVINFYLSLQNSPRLKDFFFITDIFDDWLDRFIYIRMYRKNICDTYLSLYVF